MLDGLRLLGRAALIKAASGLLTAATGLKVADEEVKVGVESVSTGADAVPLLANHPAFESRRVTFDASDLVGLLSEALLRRGLDKAKLHHARWVWVNGEHGLPRLHLIFPGIEA